MIAEPAADGYSMLDRPGDPAYFDALIGATPAAPPLYADVEPAEPIPGWDVAAQAAAFGVEPEPEWSGLVGSLVPNTRTVVSATPVTKPTGVTIEALGPSSWRVHTTPGTFTFRSVEAHRDLHADIEVRTGDLFLLRTGTSLGLTARATLTRALWAAVREGVGTELMWREAVSDAIHAVLEAVEQLGSGIDLRHGDIGAIGNRWGAEPLTCSGATQWVMPGESGKSTLARAVAVSTVSGRVVIPGVFPRVVGPVAYVASEAAALADHLLSVEAICRGLGIVRSQLEHRIELIPTRGQPLHRIARAIAERAKDCAMVVLDAQQGLLPTGDAGVRDGAALYWNALDEIGLPSLTISHPNRAASQNWGQADGRAAGAEVHRDRARLAWSGQWSDELAVAGTSYRRYTLVCTKANAGPRPGAVSFAAGWQFPVHDRDSGVLTFTDTEPVEHHQRAGEDSTATERETIAAIRAGATTPAPLAKALGIEVNAAKSRIRRLKVKGLVGSEVTE